MSYIERLKHLNLPTLKYKKLRGDMIETYKIINEKYDKNVLLNISRNDDSRTRGNSLKLKSMRTHYNLRKYSFSIRIINIWNSLPENVVTANTFDCFKTRLDKFWNSQDVEVRLHTKFYQTAQ